MSELSDAGDALNLARSRFDNARMTWNILRHDLNDLRLTERAAWLEYERAADEMAAAARRVLHEQTIAGE